MVNVYFDPDKVNRPPEVQIYVDNQLWQGVVVEDISKNGMGHTATLTIPRYFFDTDLSKILNKEIVIYARNKGGGYGFPMFRGWADTPITNLKTESVKILCRSTLNYLRGRSVNFKSLFNLLVPGTYRTFATGPEQHFEDVNPYVTERTPVLYQAADFLDYMYQLQESWMKTKWNYFIDPAIRRFELRDQTVFRFEIDGATSLPALVSQTIQVSPIGTQVFRFATWGQILDYLNDLMPGSMLIETFDAYTTWLSFVYPQTMGTQSIVVGTEYRDWKEIGATVTDITNEVFGADATNRVGAFGAPATNVICLMTEVQDDNLNEIGLLPDYTLYEPDSAPIPLIDIQYARGTPGVGAYNYTTKTYSHHLDLAQPIYKVLENPNIGKPGEAEYIQGYEHVGRRWRLPNWLAFAEMERTGEGMFVDPRSGSIVSFQVLVEMATEQVSIFDNDLSPPTPPVYLYEWRLYTGGVQLDPRDRTLTLSEIPRTAFINANYTLLENVDGSYPQKLARIALVVAVGNPNFVMYADSYLAANGVIEPSRANGIQTGTGPVFERPDMKYIQLTNLLMPFAQKYREVVPTTAVHVTDKKGKIWQEELETLKPTYYTDFIVGATLGLTEAVSAYIGTGLSGPRRDGLAKLTEPRILRDDTATLWQLVLEQIQNRGKKPRALNIDLHIFANGIERGQQIDLKNVDIEPDMDMVDSVTWNLRTGHTTITTTNQPASASFNHPVTSNTNYAA